MKIDKLFEVLIIGGGPAGLTAAIYGRRYGLSVLVIEKNVYGGTVMLTDRVDNYPGFPEGLKGKDLGSLFKSHCDEYEAEYVSDNITSLRRDGENFVLEGEGGSYLGKSVIIASGTKPRRLDIPGENKFIGRGVSFCASCDGYFFQGKDVAVIGGGDSAVSEAIFLATICHKVYVIHRRDSLRAAKALADEAKIIKNISFIWNSIPTSIIGERSVEGLEIKNVLTSEVSNLSVKGVFIYIGEEPQTDIYRGLIELDDKGYIITDENMKTSMEGVFAAGDIRKKPLRQIVTAVSDGAIAAYRVFHYLKGIE